MKCAERNDDKKSWIEQQAGKKSEPPDCSGVDVNFKWTKHRSLCVWKTLVDGKACAVKIFFCSKYLYIISFVETVPLLSFFFVQDFFCWNVISSFIFFHLCCGCCCFWIFYHIFFKLEIEALNTRIFYCFTSTLLFRNFFSIFLFFLQMFCTFFASSSIFLFCSRQISIFPSISYKSREEKVFESFSKNFGYCSQHKMFVLWTRIIKQYFSLWNMARGLCFCFA